MFPRKISSLALLFIAVFMFNLQMVESQGGAVKGRVYARDLLGNFVPVGFATITVTGDSFRTYTFTDQEGYYLIYLPVGFYNMTATLSTVTLHYVKSIIVSVWHGSDTTINFYLERAAPKPQSVRVSVSVDGVPPQYSVELRVDGSPSGKIPGGGALQVEVDWRIGHNLSVQPYLEGMEGERFQCLDNVWRLESSSHPTEGVKATKTFHYITQYLLKVSTPHGEAAKNAGWYERDSSIYLSTPRIVEVSRGVRDVFDAWNVNGYRYGNLMVNVVLTKPIEVKAEYHKEYYLSVTSEYGNPSGGGWFREGYTAEVMVEREVPMPGLIGFMGGRRVFERWSGDTSSSGNIASLYMDGPKTVVATWREDYSIPCVAAALAAIILFVLGVSRMDFLKLMNRKARSVVRGSSGMSMLDGSISCLPARLS
ncbi:MAG: carboxypeptidase-like regulatory domain-containing protein [Candidatus Bathyarchaeia archaeon]